MDQAVSFSGHVVQVFSGGLAFSGKDSRSDGEIQHQPRFTPMRLRGGAACTEGIDSCIPKVPVVVRLNREQAATGDVVRRDG